MLINPKNYPVFKHDVYAIKKLGLDKNDSVISYGYENFPELLDKHEGSYLLIDMRVSIRPDYLLKHHVFLEYKHTSFSIEAIQYLLNLKMAESGTIVWYYFKDIDLLIDVRDIKIIPILYVPEGHREEAEREVIPFIMKNINGLKIEYNICGGSNDPYFIRERVKANGSKSD